MNDNLQMQRQNQPDFDGLVAAFRIPGVVAIVLMGSHARGQAGPFSDVDLIRFWSDDDAAAVSKTYLRDGHFVVVSDVPPKQVEDCFCLPDQASAFIAGLRSGRALWDPQGAFATIQRRARRFEWDAIMQAKADAWASEEMVGWIEEAQKGLAGLRNGEEGRLLNARFGLTWGLVNVMRVQYGILISGDNDTYRDVVRAVGADSKWARLSRQAYGMDGELTLPEQVEAGLRLYVLTAELLAGRLRPDDRPMVAEAVRRITAELGESHARR